MHVNPKKFKIQVSMLHMAANASRKGIFGETLDILLRIQACKIHENFRNFTLPPTSPWLYGK